jgi:hypothetical protein
MDFLLVNEPNLNDFLNQNTSLKFKLKKKYFLFFVVAHKRFIFNSRFFAQVPNKQTLFGHFED